MSEPVIDRRTALIGAGALALAPTLARAAAPVHRRMIVRADDVGMSKVCNLGAFEAIEHGVVTSADVMLDSPGTEDALERLRKLPWITVGWHMHMWGAPVLDAARVPTLVERTGPFAGRFRTDLARASDVSGEEATAELRAQLARCRRILGHLPLTAGTNAADTPWMRAVRAVVDEAGIARNYMARPATTPAYSAYIKAAQDRGEEWAKYYSAAPSPALPADPKWAPRKLAEAAGQDAYINLLTDSVSSVEANYDAVRFYTEDRAGILKTPLDVVTSQSWHPGYLDYYTYRLGERVNRARAQQFVVGRVQDVAAMTSPVLRAWIKSNGIELVSSGDALLGTNLYQAHLRKIGSDLAV